jgi:hypothetical protein
LQVLLFESLSIRLPFTGQPPESKAHDPTVSVANTCLGSLFGPLLRCSLVGAVTAIVLAGTFSPNQDIGTCNTVVDLERPVAVYYSDRKRISLNLARIYLR